MTSSPIISVVMICYNHEKYIKEAIDSILSQTYRDFEFIIIDDGSKDSTFEIVQSYKDQRIMASTQKNSGPSVALNAGIEKSSGEYIAFMSGDDVSKPNRLMSQINQIEVQKADIIFSLPQLIGPHSEFLDYETCPGFFGREFNDTAGMYRLLFFDGNFLCAPSAFCRRSAIDKIGRFKRGLIQLQDFDYWIRACKKELVMKVYTDPLVQYRYLYGANLSDKNNLNRVRVENLEIYRSFFDDVPTNVFSKAFSDILAVDTYDNPLDFEIDKSFLLFNHPNPIAKVIGTERIIQQLEEDETYERLVQDKDFDIATFFRTANSINLDGFYGTGKQSKLRRLIKKLLIPPVELHFKKENVNQEIQRSLDKGDFQHAISLTRGMNLVRPESSLWGTFRKILIKIYKLLSIFKTKLRGFITYRTLKNWNINVYPLAKMYDYCKQANLLAYEDLPEQIYLHRPKVIGNQVGDLPEGEAYCPNPYIAILKDCIITGDSNLVISHDGIVLNDEMADFHGDEYGIKSPYVRYHYKDKVIIGYQKKPHTAIKEGILFSCGHDFNYFHWIVECLPKLLFIDNVEQFNNVPLLIPQDLHKNLETALEVINVKKHPIIRLEGGFSYHVEHLIFPSALSRILDRYQGKVVFDKDIVLSQKWISRVGSQLRNKLQPGQKPWRKLLLTRRKGLRSVENLEKLELMLLERQFEVIDLDGVSFENQLKLFSQASIIVAPTGAALTNMLFCQPGTKVFLFMSNHEITNFYFWSQLGDIAGVDLEIIAGERLYNLTNIYSVHDDYRIDLEFVINEVEKLEQRVSDTI